MLSYLLMWCREYHLVVVSLYLLLFLFFYSFLFFFGLLRHEHRPKCGVKTKAENQATSLRKETNNESE